MEACEQLLSRLNKVKACGQNKWRALCPAHDNKNTLSLKVTELPDGRLLVYCFAGCAVVDVLQAIELRLSDLWPKAIQDHMPPINRAALARYEHQIDDKRKQVQRLSEENYEITEENIRLKAQLAKKK